MTNNESHFQPHHEAGHQGTTYPPTTTTSTSSSPTTTLPPVSTTGTPTTTTTTDPTTTTPCPPFNPTDGSAVIHIINADGDCDCPCESDCGSSACSCTVPDPDDNISQPTSSSANAGDIYFKLFTSGWDTDLYGNLVAGDCIYYTDPSGSINFHEVISVAYWWMAEENVIIAPSLSQILPQNTRIYKCGSGTTTTPPPLGSIQIDNSSSSGIPDGHDFPSGTTNIGLNVSITGSGWDHWHWDLHPNAKGGSRIPAPRVQGGNPPPSGETMVMSGTSATVSNLTAGCYIISVGLVDSSHNVVSQIDSVYFCIDSSTTTTAPTTTSEPTTTTTSAPTTTTTSAPTTTPPPSYSYYYACPCSINSGACSLPSQYVYFKTFWPNYLVGSYIKINGACHKVIGSTASNTSYQTITIDSVYQDCNCGSTTTSAPTTTTTANPCAVFTNWASVAYGIGAKVCLDCGSGSVAFECTTAHSANQSWVYPCLEVFWARIPSEDNCCSTTTTSTTSSPTTTTTSSSPTTTTTSSSPTTTTTTSTTSSPTTTTTNPNSQIYTVERQWRDGYDGNGDGNCIGCGSSYTWDAVADSSLTPGLYDTVIVDNSWVGIVTNMTSGSPPNNAPIITATCPLYCASGTCASFTMTDCDDVS